MSRIVHPVSASRCCNKLPVVLRLPQHLTADTVLNFSASATYFLDPDSRLLSPIASEVPSSALFPAIYQTHQGWIAVTPDIHQARPPKPLPVTAPHSTEDVFQEQNYYEGGLYQPATLAAMQDFLLTPLLREAVTYKLAHQVHNMQPENEHALGPLNVFPTDVVAAADWRNLLFGGWWSWLEKWGKLASIFIGAYYLHVAGRWIITTLFSLKVLYDEHGFGPNLLWGLGPGQNVFPMLFYRRWRRFKQHLSQANGREAARAQPVTAPHEYLALNKVELPQLPRCNQVQSKVYPELPPLKQASFVGEGPPEGAYTTLKRRAPAGEALPCPQPPSTNAPWDPPHLQATMTPNQGPLGSTPPSAGGRPAADPLPPVVPATTDGLVGLPASQTSGLFRLSEDTFPTGPIGEVMKARP